MSQRSNLLQQSNPKLSVKEVQDIFLRDNFKSLQDYFSVQNQLLDFKFTEITFTEAQTNFKLAHGLSYVPKDILVTYQTGTGIVQFNLGLFDDTNMDLTVSGPTTIRFFYGTYWNFQSLTNPATEDVRTFAADSLTSILARLTALEARPIATSTLPSAGTNLIFLYGGVNTADGHGTVATRVRRYSTILNNLGTAMTLVDSVANGMSIVINEAGIYSFVVHDSAAGGAAFFGLTRNLDLATYGATTIGLIPFPSQLVCITESPGAGNIGVTVLVIQCAVGDTFRVHDSAGNPVGNFVNATFVATKIAN